MANSAYAFRKEPILPDEYLNAIDKFNEEMFDGDLIVKTGFNADNSHWRCLVPPLESGEDSDYYGMETWISHVHSPYPDDEDDKKYPAVEIRHGHSTAFEWYIDHQWCAWWCQHHGCEGIDDGVWTVEKYQFKPDYDTYFLAHHGIGRIHGGSVVLNKVRELACMLTYREEAKIWTKEFRKKYYKGWFPKLKKALHDEIPKHSIPT